MSDEQAAVRPKVLLVEDAESILLAIRDYLISYYDVVAVASGIEAEEKILEAVEEQVPFDLMIADIHLPDRTGLQLIDYIKARSPQSKVILITSYDINDYMEIIMESQIDQVISKHSHFSLRDLYVTANKTITNDIFGVDKYFQDIKVYYPTEMKNNTYPENRELFSVTLRSTQERIYWTDIISQVLTEKRGVAESLTKLVLDELTTNAMIRAPLHDDGNYKYQREVPDSDVLIPQDNVVLDPEDYFVIQYGYFDDWVIINCQDPHGNLRKKEVLYRLNRHITLDARTGLPDGLSDSHGRGIFLLREHLTHVIFNIQKDRKTEVLCFYHTKHDIPYKNISIYEID